MPVFSVRVGDIHGPFFGFRVVVLVDNLVAQIGPGNRVDIGLKNRHFFPGNIKIEKFHRCPGRGSVLMTALFFGLFQTIFFDILEFFGGKNLFQFSAKSPAG